MAQQRPGTPQPPPALEAECILVMFSEAFVRSSQEKGGGKKQEKRSGKFQRSKRSAVRQEEPPLPADEITDRRARDTAANPPARPSRSPTRPPARRSSLLPPPPLTFFRCSSARYVTFCLTFSVSLASEMRLGGWGWGGSGDVFGF